MKKGIAFVLVGLAVVVGALAVFVQMQPGELVVSRSAEMRAEPEDIFPLVADLHAFVQWSPWSELDPDQTVEFSGPEMGAGASYTWSGNEDVGKGRMAITAATPNTQVVEDLEFIEPFPSTAVVTIDIEDLGDTSRVTWGMVSEKDFFSKAFMMFVDMDALLGEDFAKGLANLTGMAEDRAAEREEAARIEAERIAQEAAAAPEEDEPTGTE